MYRTGALPDPSLPTDGDVLERALAVAQDSGDEEGDPEELSDNSHRDDDSSSESSEELEGDDLTHCRTVIRMRCLVSLCNGHLRLGALGQGLVLFLMITVTIEVASDLN